MIRDPVGEQAARDELDELARLEEVGESTSPLSTVPDVCRKIHPRCTASVFPVQRLPSSVSWRRSVRNPRRRFFAIGYWRDSRSKAAAASVRAPPSPTAPRTGPYPSRAGARPRVHVTSSTIFSASRTRISPDINFGSNASLSFARETHCSWIACLLEKSARVVAANSPSFSRFGILMGRVKASVRFKPGTAESEFILSRPNFLNVKKKNSMGSDGSSVFV